MAKCCFCKSEYSPRIAVCSNSKCLTRMDDNTMTPWGTEEIGGTRLLMDFIEDCKVEILKAIEKNEKPI